MPTMAYAYNNRGHALLETGKLEQGVSDIKHSLKLDDTNAYAHRNLGIYHLKLEQYEMAHNLFLKASEITPETDLIDELLQQTSAKINPQTPN
jgi:tetratricopeptide (TPR) repeat protein